MRPGAEVGRLCPASKANFRRLVSLQLENNTLFTYNLPFLHCKYIFNNMFHLLLGRARESPAPKLLLVIPSKLDCLKLAKFFRLELKVYCVRLGTKCLDRMDVQQLYPIYWTLRADGKLKIQCHSVRMISVRGPNIRYF